MAMSRAAGIELGDVAPVEHDAPGAGSFQPGDQAQQRRFAAARGADDHQHLAVGERRGRCRAGLAVSPKLFAQARRVRGSPLFLPFGQAATNQRCISTTTMTGGSRASTAVAITALQSVWVSTPIILTMPMTMVSRRGSVATSSGQRILVPAVDEQDDEQRGDVGGGDREQDIPQEAQRPGAVHPRRLHQLVGDGGEDLAEQQRRGGRGDQRHGQAGEAC